MADVREVPSGAATLASSLRARRHALRLVPPAITGRLTRSIGLTLEADGVDAVLGDRCVIDTRAGRAIEAEVVGFDRARTLLMPIGEAHGLHVDAPVRTRRDQARFPAGDRLLGRTVGASGEPLDGLGGLKPGLSIDLGLEPIAPLSRGAIVNPFDVGVRSINALMSLGRGQRVGLFAGSGVGKSALLGMMTRHASVDVTVVALIGERGREVRDFVVDTLGPIGLQRAVVVAVPADRPPLQRLQGVAYATAIAEHFRAEGQEVLLVVDSLTRCAQAQREIGLAIGEPPTTRGYPPSVFTLLPRLVERAGALAHGGSITGVYTVLAEGDDQNDPIVDAARAILDGHLVLSRTLADAGRYPAIDLGASISRVRDAVTDDTHRRATREVLRLYAAYRENEDMIRVGLYHSGTDPTLDRAIALWPRLERFLAQTRDERSGFEESVSALHALSSASRT